MHKRRVAKIRRPTRFSFAQILHHSDNQLYDDTSTAVQIVNCNENHNLYHQLYSGGSYTLDKHLTERKVSCQGLAYAAEPTFQL